MSVERRDGGLYALCVELWRPTAVSIGALGSFQLQAGCYVYVGSARRNRAARIRRHLAPTKKVRWHIDHLSLAGRPSWALLFDEDDECALNRGVGQVLGGVVPIPGFGASDCSVGCPAHLWFTPTSPWGPLGLFAEGRLPGR